MTFRFGEPPAQDGLRKIRFSEPPEDGLIKFRFSVGERLSKFGFSEPPEDAGAVRPPSVGYCSRFGPGMSNREQSNGF